MKKIRNVAFKGIAFCTFLLGSVLLLGTFVGGVAIIAEEVYFKTEKEWYTETMGRYVKNEVGYPLLTYLTRNDRKSIRELCEELDIFYIAVVGEERGVQFVYGEQDGREHIRYESDWEWYNGAYSRAGTYDEDVEFEQVRVTVMLKDELTPASPLYYENMIAKLMFSWRYWIWVLLVAEVLVEIGMFVYLMWASGRREDGSISKGWGTFVPIEILTAATFTAGAISIILIDESFGLDALRACFAIVLYLFCVTIALGWCMSVAVRLKLGILMKESLIAYLWRGIRKVLSFLWPLVLQLPMVWRTCIMVAAVTIIEFFILAVFRFDADMLFLSWFAEKVILGLAIIYSAIAFYRLRKGTKALAQGDLSAQIETKYLHADFKEHGKDLNNIGCVVAKAVKEQLKSERMKTELITNVSHDIKTPVTSIINYSDLLQKESDTDKMKEYAEVIWRQSDKLKNLVEDLVEASKASTGNLEVQMMPTDAGVLLTQAAGEYEKRLKDAGLELVMNCPEDPVLIMADGRRMWRVFDNLLNNICKYSLNGTRVYLTVENRGGEVIITFRNTSRDALNIAPDELLERFTRADVSRHTEGNGLGLSIAKSLTQLQNGRLELVIDGDLFKAVLIFARVDV